MTLDSETITTTGEVEEELTRLAVKSQLLNFEEAFHRLLWIVEGRPGRDRLLRAASMLPRKLRREFGKRGEDERYIPAAWVEELAARICR
jgi:hypothetical protein